MTVWLPLVGENDKGVNPKACAERGWNLPDYRGIRDIDNHNGWIGRRLDDYIVVDCDCAEAMEAWLKHIDRPLAHTLVRRTPHGYHFYYRRSFDVLDVRPQKLLGISPKLELKTGVGHQVVFIAPGYKTEVNQEPIAFDRTWVPSAQVVQVTEEWSEMPEGIGDNSMISFAGTFRRWGMDRDTILRCLEAVNTITMTENPMPPKSLRRIARQAAGYEPEAARTCMCPKCGSEVEVR